MPIFDEPRCVVDVETWMPRGGGRHRLIEIAAMVVDVDGRPAIGTLDASGRSAGNGTPLMYQRLCRPAELPSSPRQVRLHNAIQPRWLYSPQVAGEAIVVRDFVEWHYSMALDSLLIAYNSSFDKAALAGAMKAAGMVADLQWGRCLMLSATETLMLTRKDGRVRRKAPKSEIAASLFDVDLKLRELAGQVGWTGPLTMHLGLPDVLIEVAILIAIRRQQLATLRAAPKPTTQASLTLAGDT